MRSQSQAVENARPLGLASATAIVVANMIGTGVFTTSGFLLADLGSRRLVLLAWVVGGIMASLGALSYGALARRIPESGGEYILLSRTLHPVWGYIAGWISLLVGFSAPLAAAAYGFGEYTKAWFGQTPAPVSGSILIVAFALIHGLEVRRGARIQDWAVLVKVVLIVGLILFGLGRINWEAAAPSPPVSLSAFAVSLVWISFSYSGWNAAIYIAGEIAAPERNLPRALIGGTVIVMLLYLGLNAIFVFSAPVSELAGKLQIGRIAAEALGGPALAEAVTALVALALVTSVSSMLMVGPRVYSRMAADGYLPGILSVAQGPPRAAITLQALLALGILWTASYEALLTYIGFTLSLSTAATVWGLMRLRLREKEALPVPGWPWAPALFIGGVLGIAAFSVARRPLESGIGLATLALGAAVWFGRDRQLRRKSRATNPPPDR